MLLLENIGTSIKVGPSQLPTLHHLLTEAAGILGMEAPDLYVRQVRLGRERDTQNARPCMCGRCLGGSNEQ